MGPDLRTLRWRGKEVRPAAARLAERGRSNNSVPLEAKKLSVTALPNRWAIDPDGPFLAADVLTETFSEGRPTVDTGGPAVPLGGEGHRAHSDSFS